MKNNYLNLAKKCIEQNKLLIKKNLVIHNFGNVSLRFDDDHFIIKPSIVNLLKIKPGDIPMISIKSKKKVKGKLKPSSDTAIHNV